MQDGGEEDGDNDRLELDDNTAHFINTLTIRDVQLLLLQGLYSKIIFHRPTFCFKIVNV